MLRRTLNLRLRNPCLRLSLQQYWMWPLSGAFGVTYYHNLRFPIFGAFFANLLIQIEK